jgi:hypothetical protein
MVSLRPTGHPHPYPDESGPGSFRVGSHTQRYRRSFKDRARLTLRVSRDSESDELFVSWQADGQAAGAPCSGELRGLEISEQGHFPYTLTGLPLPGPA